MEPVYTVYCDVSFCKEKLTITQEDIDCYEDNIELLTTRMNHWNINIPLIQNRVGHSTRLGTCCTMFILKYQKKLKLIMVTLNFVNTMLDENFMN